jgi:hypothetical protein
MISKITNQKQTHTHETNAWYTNTRKTSRAHTHLSYMYTQSQTRARGHTPARGHTHTSAQTHTLPPHTRTILDTHFKSIQAHAYANLAHQFLQAACIIAGFSTLSSLQPIHSAPLMPRRQALYLREKRENIMKKTTDDHI